MMTALINKIGLIFRIALGARVLVLEKRYDKKRQQDKVTLWGSIQPRHEQVHTLYKMADSIFSEMNPEELDNFHKLHYPKQ